MDESIMKAALQFLERVELKGSEVPTFNAVCQAIIGSVSKELSEPSVSETEKPSEFL